MTIITSDKINEDMTKAVSAYIAKGYFLSPSMRGSQGERLRVDLYSLAEKKLVRIYQKEDFGIHDRENCMMLIIAETGFSATADLEETVWNQSMRTVSEKAYYKVAQRRNCAAVYTEDYSEYCEIVEKQRKRYSYDPPCRRSCEEVKVSAERILGLIHRHRGYGRVKAPDVQAVKKMEDCYLIEIKGKKPIKVSRKKEGANELKGKYMDEYQSQIKKEYAKVDWDDLNSIKAYNEFRRELRKFLEKEQGKEEMRSRTARK